MPASKILPTFYRATEVFWTGSIAPCSSGHLPTYIYCYLLSNILTSKDTYYYYFLLVVGHTDSLKISTVQFPSNWELSSARASAVVRYRINHGIDNNRLSGIGHAYNFPLATNLTPEGRDLNRRVEFIFTRVPLRSVIDWNKKNRSSIQASGLFK